MKVNSTRKKELKRFDKLVSKLMGRLNPPITMTVSEWADKYRYLSAENSAEAGLWRTSRTPYLKDIMDAFSDPKVKRIAVAASSQVGKSEMLLNMLAYSIDGDPGSAMLVQPTEDVAKDFSKRRITPMIRDCPRLASKVADSKARDSANTVLKKTYPGGMLTITGANSPASLASIPSRYVFGDERDRWPVSAGSEGDPWELLTARTKTFYNAKMVEVSTPTIKDYSNIEKAYYLGTQERWKHKCPGCGEFHEITFDDIRFDYDKTKKKKKETYVIKSVHWICPSCGSAFIENEMKGSQAKWVADNPIAYENGVRSYWLTAFASPWERWDNICLKFLESKDDPARLQVFYNTMLGKLWELRTEVEDEETYLSRREVYDAELPDKVLYLTCGIDTQDDRLEYEVVGFGLYGETYGIRKGIIMGTPDIDDVWQRLDDVIDHEYRYKDGKSLKIEYSFIDSGGHYTQEVYKRASQRLHKRLFAIKGKGGDDIEYVKLPKKVAILDKSKRKRIGSAYLYTLGVDAGKEKIFSALKVQEEGPRYCHFPINPEKGYDEAYFHGLLSEQLVCKSVRGVNKWYWEKIPGHERNEALDCRNYALAAFYANEPDLQAIYDRKMGIVVERPRPIKKPKKKKTEVYSEW